MLDRIMGAFTFKQGVYGEVKKDASFTPSAWLIVAFAALLNAIGSSASLVSNGGVLPWLLTSIGLAVFNVLGFALACLVIVWVAKTFFNAPAVFDEVVRATGLSWVWRLVSVLGVFTIISPALGCVVGIFSGLALIAGLVAWLFAIKESIGMEWPQTVGTVIIAWVVTIIVSMVAFIVLGAFGLVTAGLLGAFR
jgi:hypothetical protein